MGLSQWNVELRTPLYPPFSVSGALEFSSSETVEEAYKMTEDLFTGGQCTYVLPPWAMTWPGGQLSGIGRNGLYANNIKRYESVFSEVFSEGHSAGTRTCSLEKVPASSKLRFVNVVPLEFLGDKSRLNSTLASLMGQVDGRRAVGAPSLSGQTSQFNISNGIHRNAIGNLSPSYLEPTKTDTKQIAMFFCKDSAELGSMTGLKLSWMNLDAPLP